MELEIIKAVQSISSPLMDSIFQFITMLGEEMFLIPVMAYVYWCVDKKKGIYIIQTMAASLTVGNILKNIFKMPRPIGLEGVRSVRVETATGYSMPSIHTQNITSLLTSYNLLNGGLVSVIISVIAVLMVGLSRVYLGVHYPKDVLAGMILGIIVPLVLCVVFEKLRNELTISLIILGFMTLGFFIDPSPDFYKSYGLCLGIFAGLFIEKAFVDFAPPKNRKKKITRFILGFIMTSVLYAALKYFMPEENFWHTVRYCMISVFSMGIYPLIFKKLKI